MPGLQFIEGFETFGANGATGTLLQDTLLQKWVYISLATSAKLSDAAYESQGLCLDLISGSSSYYGIFKTVPPVSNEVIVGWAWYTGALTSNNRSLYLGFSDNQLMNLLTLTGGGFRISHGGGSTDTGLGLVTANTWHYIELKYKIDDAPNGYWELYIDGSLVDSATGIDTWSAGRPKELARHSWGSGENINTRLDDIYIYDNTGDAIEPYGPVKIRAIFPSADDITEWSSTGGNHYDQVNDVPVNTSTYVESDTATDRDYFEFEDPSDPSTWPIYGVQLNIYAAVTGAGLHTLEGVAFSNGSKGTVPEVLADDLGGQYCFIFDTDPDTSGPWSMTKLAAASFGVEVG